MNDLKCPRCKHEFEGQEWHNGECPKCGNEYTWDEMVAEDYSDSWILIEWAHYE